jgi:DNA-binding SARP family transcriptional activator
VTSGLEFALLGSVRAWRDGAEVGLGSPQQRATLVLLLSPPGHLVPVDAITTAVWGDDAPPAARGTIRTYVHHLRRVLGGPAKAPVIESSGGGYRLNADAESTDASRFRLGVEKARAARAQGDLGQAANLLSDALGLWQGAALIGASGDFVQAQRDVLHDAQNTALEELYAIELEQGKIAEVLEKTTRLLSTEPLRERLHEVLILALYRVGRQAEALVAYERARRLFRDELGADPGPRLRDLHERILRHDPNLLPLSAESMIVTSARKPAQLPADQPAFVGRAAELASMRALLPADPDRPLGSAVVTVIEGLAAIGKTTLAVHAAHRIAEHFPDGQLYVDFRGFDPHAAPLEPAEVIRGFLDALGVQPVSIPSRLDEQAALFRGLLVERRMLILLDNVNHSEQVLPLLPGKSGSLVLVTSRYRLSGLIAATNASTTILEVLSELEAEQFLAKRLGPSRVAAEPDAVRTIVGHCHRLPLALAVTAARALSQPNFPLSAIADELAEAQGSLDAFAGTERNCDVRAALSLSYKALSPEAARLFRLLSPHRGLDISASAAASIAALPLRVIRGLLRELTNAHLVSEQFPGRFSRHELVRVYAAELLQENETESEREEALQRMFDHYLHVARGMCRFMSDPRDTMELPAPAAGVVLDEPADRQQAADWFDTEYRTVLGLINSAAALGFPAKSWQLTWTLRHYMDRLGHWHDLAESCRKAMAVAKEHNDRSGEAYMLRGICRARCMLGALDEGEKLINEALTLFETLDDSVGLAYTLRQAQGMAALANDFDKARAYTERALTLFRADDWGPGEATVLLMMAWNRLREGDPHSALYYGHQAETLFEQYEDLDYHDDNRECIGLAYHQLGRYAEAIACFERVIALHKELGGALDQADALMRLSETLRVVGNDEQSRATFEEAVLIRKSLGLRELSHTL